MLREEAIGKWIYPAIATMWNEKKCKEILEALEQEPCEDAISRQAVLNEIPVLWNSNGDKDYCMESLRDFVAELPSVIPQPKTGHWILKRTFPTKIYDEYLNEYKCSECYREIRCTESQLVNYPYCHCGARMIVPQESEE